jgi:hypothetical protein
LSLCATAQGEAETQASHGLTWKRTSQVQSSWAEELLRCEAIGTKSTIYLDGGELGLT